MQKISWERCPVQRKEPLRGANDGAGRASTRREKKRAGRPNLSLLTRCVNFTSAASPSAQAKPGIHKHTVHWVERFGSSGQGLSRGLAPALISPQKTISPSPARAGARVLGFDSKGSRKASEGTPIAHRGGSRSRLLRLGGCEKAPNIPRHRSPPLWPPTQCSQAWGGTRWR